jgi:hypothetical protein
MVNIPPSILAEHPATADINQCVGFSVIQGLRLYGPHNLPSQWLKEDLSSTSKCGRILKIYHQFLHIRFPGAMLKRKKGFGSTFIIHIIAQEKCFKMCTNFSCLKVYYETSSLLNEYGERSSATKSDISLPSL